LNCCIGNTSTRRLIQKHHINDIEILIRPNRLNKGIGLLKRNLFEPINLILDENDSGILQLRDELDPERVGLWRKGKKQNKTTTKELTFDVVPPKKAIQQNGYQK